jgi:twitching motility protein PilU
MHLIDTYLSQMVEHGASDLYLTHQSPAAYRVGEHLKREGDALDDTLLTALLTSTLSLEQQKEFKEKHELNMALSHKDARFRLNIFLQQQHFGMVIRHIQTEIPAINMLGLPAIYEKLAMQPRGLVLIAGPTGSGKTTSLAAMIGHRNVHSEGHIITVEDPVEYMHAHQGCIVTQRDVGIDTDSYAQALKNALRQRPDVVAIGEIRDREVMEQALYFAETGHLCIATIHASNTTHAIERAVNIFPEARQAHVRHHLSVHLLAVLAQRLLPGINGERCASFEILRNLGFIRQLIAEGKTQPLKDMIAKGEVDGMICMDDTLMALYEKGMISEETACAEASNPALLSMKMRKRGVASLAHTPNAKNYKLKKSDSW